MEEVGGRVIGPVIRAAGGVVWRRDVQPTGTDGVVVAVIHRPRYDDWSLPKGKLAPGESDLEGAVREVLEETGFHVRVGRPLGETRYEKSTDSGPRLKIIRWWAMQAEEGTFAPTREVDQLRWLSLADAAGVITRPSDHDVLERFARGQAPTRTVLLVRHASAGSRSSWNGDDGARPLDECGISQADEVVRILSRFEVGSVISAPHRRCVDTVLPVARAFDLEVVREPVLSEVGYPGREHEAVALIRHLGDVEHDAVVCSQGDVIPDLLQRIGAEDQFAMEAPIRSSKGSIWALTIDSDGRIAAADYIEAPRPPPCGEPHA